MRTLADDWASKAITTAGPSGPASTGPARDGHRAQQPGPAADHHRERSAHPRTPAPVRAGPGRAGRSSRGQPGYRGQARTAAPDGLPDADSGPDRRRARGAARNDRCRHSGGPRDTDCPAGCEAAWRPQRVRRPAQVRGRAFVKDEPGALAFPGVMGGPLRRGNFNKMSAWPYAVRSTGPEGLHFHDLRHTGNTFAEMSRIASDATFGGSGERPLPAVQCGRPGASPEPRWPMRHA
jgi:hypothetical protein